MVHNVYHMAPYVVHLCVPPKSVTAVTLFLFKVGCSPVWTLTNGGINF